jgi:ubiquinone/menaquinone biosynthesis C-methylase UbiE
MKTPEAEAKRIFGERAARYTSSAAHADPQVLARVVELAAPQPDWLVLDVATGTGHTAFALAGHVHAVIGIDLTVEMLRESKQLRAARNVSNVAFGLADVHHLPFPSQTFHLVTCRCAAHHFSRIGQALGEMRRVLRTGGRLVIDDRSVPEDDFVDTCMNRLDRYHDESHVREYRPSEWQKLLEGSGFAVEVVESYVRHRPLTALTKDVSAGHVRRIQEVLDELTSDQRTALNLREVDGELHLNHWYVMISGTKRAWP